MIFGLQPLNENISCGFKLNFLDFLSAQAINGLKNVESTAMLQFLQPTLNMLLRMIGDGGETLQASLLPFDLMCTYLGLWN